MSATYSPNLATNKDRVRLFLGDTNIASALWSDEEINAAFAVYNNSLLTAARLAESAAGKFSRSVTFGVEGLTIQNAQKAENYRLLADLLRRRYDDGDKMGLPIEDPNAPVPGSLSAPVLTGVSRGDMAAADGDPDRPRSAFGLDMIEDPMLPKGTILGPDDDLIH